MITIAWGSVHVPEINEGIAQFVASHMVQLRVGRRGRLEMTRLAYSAMTRAKQQPISITSSSAKP